MYRIMIAGLTAVGLSFGVAHAVCPATKNGSDGQGATLTINNIRSLVLGNTACGRTHAGYAAAGDTWNEFHQGSGNAGNIVELGAGGGSATIGTWAINNANGNDADSITYVYAGGGTFTYVISATALDTVNNIWRFCQTAATVDSNVGLSFAVRVKAGQTASPAPGSTTAYPAGAC